MVSTIGPSIRTLHGALLIINKLFDTTQIIGPKMVIRA
jgi:hypothetical protein